MEWIEFDKKRPETEGRYLVFVDINGREPIVIAQLDSDFRGGSAMWYWEEGEIGYCSEPTPTFCKASGTFWMQLPDRPIGC